MTKPYTGWVKFVSLLTLFALTVLSPQVLAMEKKPFAERVTPTSLIDELRKIRASPKKLATVLRVDDAYHSQEYDARSLKSNYLLPGGKESFKYFIQKLKNIQASDIAFSGYLSLIAYKQLEYVSRLQWPSHFSEDGQTLGERIEKVFSKYDQFINEHIITVNEKFTQTPQDIILNYLYGLLSKYQSDSGYFLDVWTYYAGAAMIPDRNIEGKWWISIILSRQHYVKKELLQAYPKDPFFELRKAAGIDHKKYFLLDGYDSMNVKPSGDMEIIDAIDVGGWGGSCSCGNGRVYYAGDNYDSCGSLACIGGKAGECKKSQSDKWAGNRIICAELLSEPTDVKVKLYTDPFYSKGNDNIGSSGGTCSCPSGEVYQVGTENHSCDTMACVGGTAGTCSQKEDPIRKGVRVVCGLKIDLEKKMTFPNLVNEVTRGNENVGGWGGTCVCPNGESYRVGDNNDFCKTMACIDGKTGLCEREHKEERNGVLVKCAKPTAEDIENTPKSASSGRIRRKNKKTG